MMCESTYVHVRCFMCQQNRNKAYITFLNRQQIKLMVFIGLISEEKSAIDFDVVN